MMNLTIEQIDDLKIYFIVAQPRTGSTLLASMLNMHENVLTITEQNFYFLLHKPYAGITKWSEKDVHNYCDDLFLFAHPSLPFQFGAKEDLAALLLQYLDKLNFQRLIRLTYLCFHPSKNKSKLKIIINKEIKIDDFFLPVIQLFPDSKYLFLYRNPLDNVIRTKVMLKNNYQAQQSLLYTAIEWNYRYQKLLSGKSFIPAHNFIEIKYEDIILDGQHTLEHITKFLEIPFHEDLLNYHTETQKRFQEITHQQHSDPKQINHFIEMNYGITQQPNASKINLWRNELTQDEATLVWRICGETAIQMGYSKPTDLNPQNHFSFSRLIVYLKFKYLNVAKTQLWLKMPFQWKKDIKLIKRKWNQH